MGQELVRDLGIALGIGLLVGLQREWADSRLAGIRTFPMIARFGQAGMFAVAGMSGLTDMDAITLSTAQFFRSDQLEASTGWRLILVGAMANIVFKGGVVAALGQRRLLGRIAVGFGVSIGVGVLLLLFWPG